MPSITNEQLKGNFAENLVAEWISRICLVRPVAVGTDIGIDLYCEAIVNNNPYLHFWVQVKAIGEKDITVKDGIEFASYRFTRSHLEYWSKQPIPVYTFLVPVIGWPPKYPDRIYAIRITKHVVENGLPEKDSIKLETSECTELASIDKDLEQFIKQVVPTDSAILLFSKGIVSNINFLDVKYQHFPLGVALKYGEEILSQVRDAAIILGSETLDSNIDEYKGFRQKCEAIAYTFISNMHELGVDFLTKSAIKDNDIPRALHYLDIMKNEVLKRTDIDSAKKSELLSEIEKKRNTITNRI